MLFLSHNPLHIHSLSLSLSPRWRLTLPSAPRDWRRSRRSFSPARRSCTHYRRRQAACRIPLTSRSSARKTCCASSAVSIHTLLTLSSHLPHTLLTLSSHSPHTLLSLSSHSPHTKRASLNCLSAHTSFNQAASITDMHSSCHYHRHALSLLLVTR